MIVLDVRSRRALGERIAEGKNFTCFFALLVLSTLTGCSQWYRTAEIIRDDPGLTTIEAGAINPARYTLSGMSAPLYSYAVGATPAPASMTRKEARNILQATILTLSDRATEAHLASIFATEDSANLSLGLTTLALSATGAAAVGEMTKTALAAASTGTAGARALISDEIYSGAFAPAITKAIRTSRRKRALELELKRRELDITTYTAQDAVNDAVRYHQLGSFFHGLELVHRATERANELIETQEISPLRRQTDAPASLGYTRHENTQLRHELTLLLARRLDPAKTPIGIDANTLTTAEYTDQTLIPAIDPTATRLQIRIEGGEKLAMLVDALRAVAAE